MTRGARIALLASEGGRVLYAAGGTTPLTAIVPPAGPRTCEVTEPVPFTVTLRNRIGSRALLDGGSYPPRKVQSPS